MIVLYLLSKPIKKFALKWLKNVKYYNPPFFPQRVTATFTPGDVASTWSCTNCRGGRAEAFVSTAVTTQLDATATTAKRVTTETCPSPSHTGKPAKVQWCPSHSHSFQFHPQFLEVNTLGISSGLVVSLWWISFILVQLPACLTLNFLCPQRWVGVYWDWGGRVVWYGRGCVPSTVELFAFCVCVCVSWDGGMTGLAKQRGEVWSDLVKNNWDAWMIGERAAGQGEKARKKREGGGKRMKDGRGRKEEHAPTQVCSLLSAWMDCMPSAPSTANKGQSKGGEGAAGGEGVIEKDRDVFSPPL